MSIIRVFPYAIAALEVIACAVYAQQQEWRMVIVYGGYALAAFALAGVR